MGQTVTFGDVVKQSFMELNSSGPLTFADIGMSLLCTLILALGIFWIYKKTFRGVLYTHSYNISLVMISLVTS